MRNLWKIALAAAFLVLLQEALRFVGMPNNIAANMRQIIYGTVLIMVIFKSNKLRLERPTIN
jgi:branched-chain amino acid transport system permease protein